MTASPNDIVIYHGTEEWSAIYIGGKLVDYGDTYRIYEAVMAHLGIEVRDDDAWVSGGKDDTGVLRTLAEVDEFAQKRAARNSTAEMIERRARELEELARKVRAGEVSHDA